MGTLAARERSALIEKLAEADILLSAICSHSDLVMPNVWNGWKADASPLVERTICAEDT
ncbi:MAG: hypothetical protein ACXWIR_00905 [Croceibacterium sp.]